MTTRAALCVPTADFAENSRSLLVYPCSCVKSVMAKNYSGQWLPEPHEAPRQRRQSDMKGRNTKRQFEKGKRLIGQTGNRSACLSSGF
jgi:hypothetical protein